MTKAATDGVVVLGPANAVPSDVVVPFYLEQRKQRISVARVGGRLYGFDDLCTCASEPCPLSGGLLTGSIILCQCHGSRFDISSGAVLSGPATHPLPVYKVEEAAGNIQLTLFPSRS